MKSVSNTDICFQQRFGDNVGQLLDPNHASILKSAAGAGQPSGYDKISYGCFYLLMLSDPWWNLCFRQMLHSSAGGVSPQVQARSQQFPGSAPVSTFIASLFRFFTRILVLFYACIHITRKSKLKWILCSIKEVLALKAHWLESLVCYCLSCFQVIFFVRNYRCIVVKKFWEFLLVKPFKLWRN